jgi:maleate isomerase
VAASYLHTGDIVANRQVFGRVTPTLTSRAVEELRLLLPDDIEIDDIRHSIKHGTIAEFKAAIDVYETYVAQLAARKVDLIQASGTPPFMLLGYKKEREVVERWERLYGVPIFTSGQNQIRALRALRIRKLVGIGYDFEDTTIVKEYLTDAGFDVLVLAKLSGRWENVQNIEPATIATEIKELCRGAPGVEGVYIQGAKIQLLHHVEKLEEELGLPVVHPGVANAWEIMLRLSRRAPQRGFGQLLAEFPAG